MKKLILIIITLTITTSAQAFEINGIPVEKFKVSPVKAISGAAASAFVHLAGHYAVGEVFGVSMTQDGLYERWDKTPQPWEEAIIGRAGFIAQLTTGYILNKLDIDSDFRMGFNTMTFIEITTYDMVHGNSGDMANINLVSDAGAEVAAYSKVAQYLMGY